MEFFIDFILNINNHIVNIVNTFGNWTYLILFAVIFIETGSVIFPFLPGESLLFAAAALAANPNYNLNIIIFIAIFLFASLLGDSSSFLIGKTLGRKVIHNKWFNKLVKPSQIEKSNQFVNKHGAGAIFIARFIPIIRTFTPFIIGSNDFKYSRFLKYNSLSCITWTLLCCICGYFFGNIPIVQDNFSLIIILIIIISLLPVIFEYIKSRFTKK